MLPLAGVKTLLIGVEVPLDDWPFAKAPGTASPLIPRAMAAAICADTPGGELVRELVLPLPM